MFPIITLLFCDKAFQSQGQYVALHTHKHTTVYLAAHAKVFDGIFFFFGFIPSFGIDYGGLHIVQPRHYNSMIQPPSPHIHTPLG